MRVLTGLLLAALLPPATLAEDKEAAALRDKVIRAAGGEKELAAVGAFTFKAKGTIHGGGKKIEVDGEWSLAGDRFRWDADATQEGRTNRGGILGKEKKLWLIDYTEDQTNAVPDAETATGMRSSILAFGLVQNPALLKKKGVTLSHLGELKIDGVATVGLKVTRKGEPEVDVYYDTKTHLPVKCELRVKDTKDGGDVAHVFLFGGFKPAGKLKHPTRLKFVREGTTHLDLELSDVTPRDKLDDSVFALPGK